MANRWIGHSVAVVAFLLLAGCVPSLHPLYTENDLIFEAALIGGWTEADDVPETWRFARSTDSRVSDKAYRAVFIDEDGLEGEFVAHLLRIRGKMFLDFYPDLKGMDELKRSFFYRGHWLPVHTFAAVEQIEPTLKMSFMAPGPVQRCLEAHPNAVQHTIVEEDGLVLTSAAPGLQAFVLKYFADLFDDPIELKRAGRRSPLEAAGSAGIRSRRP